MAGRDPAYNGEFWRERRPNTHARKVVENGIPVLLWTGWRDFTDAGAIRTYVALQNAFARRDIEAPMSSDKPASPRYQIIISDLGHGEALNSAIMLQWMETWVKGVDTGIARTDVPMHLFESGTNRWTNIKGFPLAQTYTPWRFAPAGGLSLAAPPRASIRTVAWGEPDRQGNALSFTTPPLMAGATLSGPMSATIYAMSNSTNLLLIGKLYDVAPDGSQAEITRGAMLGSQRELDKARTWYDTRGVPTWPWQTLTHDDYLIPGRTYRFDMLLTARHRGILPNHRLRFELTTQTPVDICPRQGIPVRSTTDVCGLTAPQRKTVLGGIYSIMIGGAMPSTLNLPQLPFRTLPESRSQVLPEGWNIGPPEHWNLPLPVDWASR